ncbi:hypothetical protein B0H11DRAFT_2208891 [Mycena galericulata]|nr:hypothetical protein B0H11DRAFT_2208891 [Mycena galericulata]
MSWTRSSRYKIVRLQLGSVRPKESAAESDGLKFTATCLQAQEVSDSLAEHTINCTCSKGTFHIGLFISQTLVFSHTVTTSGDASRPAYDVSTGSLVPTLPDME